MTELNKIVNGEALDTVKFQNPSKEFGILPFWFWNGKMDYEEMEFQLQEFKNKGLPGICVHARFGINDHIPYLSEDWFDRIEFAVRTAQKLGLQIWVYDEYNWPSGTAGQSIMKDKPELTNRYLELVEDYIPGQYFTFMEGTDSRYHDLEQSTPIYACAILEEDIKNGRPNFVDLMPSLSFNKVISWEAPPGPWKLFYFIERKAEWYTDVLDEEAVDEFLARTHQRYKERLGPKELSASIGAIYTDEPAMHYFEIFKNNNTIPWSRRMFSIFKEHNGYNLRPLLPHLFYKINAESERIRYDFYSALSAQYENTFYKKISGWCRDNGVLFTGHLLCEESIRLHAKTGGNLFHMLRHMDITGVDHLYPRVGTREMPEEHVALKIASSAAHQNGSTRLICESMGGLYWDCTMERMKWVADWEYVLGVNILNPHGFHYSIEGSRKRDWPPSQFYHHTWWEQYASFNTYLSRLGYALTGGRHVAKIAILYPINSVWSTYTPQIETPVNDIISREFAWLCDRLLRLHTDFDILDEDIMAQCTIENGRLCIMDEQYEALILPAVTHIKTKTLDIMEAFVKSGGSILADTLLPVASVTENNESIETRIEELFGENPEKIRRNYENTTCNKGLVLKEKAGGSKGLVLFAQGTGFEKTNEEQLLKEAVYRMVTPEIEISSDEIFCLHRVKDGKDFFFLINPTEQSINAKISIKGNFTPELWSLENGTIKTISAYTVKDGVTSFELGFPSVGSYLISVREYSGNFHALQANFTITHTGDDFVRGYSKNKTATAVLSCGTQAVKITKSVCSPTAVSLPDLWDFKTDKPNCILTGSWKMSYSEGQNSDDFAKTISANGYSFSQWKSFRMGAWEMQLEEERVTPAYPINLWFAASLEAAYMPKDACLLIDGFSGTSYSLYVNGMPVRGDFERSYLDAEILSAPVAGHLKLGRNIIAVCLTVQKPSDGMLDLLKLIGSFTVEEKNGQDTIMPPKTQISTGNWCEQGFPYYSGSGLYSANVQIGEHLTTGHRIILETDVGTDIIELEINGKDAGKRMWKPYSLDITEFIIPGSNVIKLRVINTLVNIMEGKKQPSGLFSASITAYPEFEICENNREGG